jgi:hypothetical protein
MVTLIIVYDQTLMIDYSQRYSANWSTVSAEVKRLQTYPDGRVKCACCLAFYSKDAVETHHLYYTQGSDGIAGENLVAVCGSTTKPGSCHHLLHTPEYYIRDKDNPQWGNRNRSEVIKKLQTNWQLIQGEIVGNFPTTYPPLKYQQQLGDIALELSRERLKGIRYKRVSWLESANNVFRSLAIPIGALVVLLLLLLISI